MSEAAQTKIPPVLILKSIRPANSGTGEASLTYTKLDDAVDEYQATHPQRVAEVWESAPGSLEELSAARELAAEYLLWDAEKVINADDSTRDLWADRFTAAAIELYGEPDPQEAARLLSDEYVLLAGLQGNKDISEPHLQLLLDTYKSVLHDVPTSDESISSIETDRAHEQEAIQEYGEAIRKWYQDLFKLVDDTKLGWFTPQDLHELFSTALDWLETHNDPEWKDWDVVYVDATDLSIEAGDREIRIPSRREPASADDLKGLIAHELLVHALRAKNGYKTGDYELAIGLPGYLDAEEGLGILAEEAITGTLPVKAYDRYVDIALALGSVDGVQRTRRQVFEISYARQLIRSQVAGTPVNERMAAKVWKHVDRIYRGGKGDEAGKRQAIFTKDIAYYEGYKQMAKYVSDQLAQSRSAEDIFVHLSRAKFDPTNPLHVKRLSKKVAK